MDTVVGLESGFANWAFRIHEERHGVIGSIQSGERDLWIASRAGAPDRRLHMALRTGIAVEAGAETVAGFDSSRDGINLLESVPGGAKKR
jgi:hypothetical protein